MGKVVRKRYTPVGRRMAALDRGQRELASALGISQQTVSRKLRGKGAILLSDLEKLAQHYGVPVAYFLEDGETDPELDLALARIRRAAGPAAELAILASGLPARDASRILQIARALTSSAGNEAAGRGRNTGPPAEAGGR